MNLHMKHLMRKGTILLCAGALLVSPACTQAGEIGRAHV